MKARRVDRFLHVHAVVDDVEQGLQHGRDDAAAAGRAEHHHQLAALADDGRAHRAERPLAGRDRVRFALHQAVAVRHAELGGEVVHLVVEQHAGARRGDLGAEPVVQGVGHGDGVALAIDDRVVRRVAALVRRQAGLQVVRDPGAGRIDGGTDFRGVGLVEQALDRVLHEVGIAERVVAVEVGMAHRLDLYVHRGRRVKAPFAERIALEDVEHLAQDHAARARRRRRDDLQAAVVALDRGQLAAAVLVEVRLRDDSLAGPAGSDDRLGHRPGVEAGDTGFGDLLQGRGEIALHQAVAGGPGLALVEKDRRRRRVGAQGSGRRCEHVGIALLEHEALLGEADRRRDQLGAFHRPVLRECGFEAGHRARHRDGQMAGGGRLPDHVASGVEVHVRGGGQRCLLAEVEESLLAVGELQRHEAAAAEVAGGRVHHRQRVADRDRGVDRVAAFPQHLDTSLGGEMLGRHDHAVLRGHRRRRGRGGLAAGAGEAEQQGQDEEAGAPAGGNRGHALPSGEPEGGACASTVSRRNAAARAGTIARRETPGTRCYAGRRRWAGLFTDARGRRR